MKHTSKIIIVLALLVTSAFVFNLKKDKEEYTITAGNELNDLAFNTNRYITKLNNTIVQYNETIPSQFVKKAENDYLELYLEESALAIAVRDRSTGYVWYSYDVKNTCLSNPEYNKASCPKISDQNWRLLRSGINVEMYNQYSPISKTVLDSEKPVLTYQELENGFKVTVDFQGKILIKFDLHVTINGKDLVTEVPRNSIKEYNPLLFKSGKSSETDPDVSLKNIMVFPQLGATSEQPNGYFVIPDGSGVLLNLPKQKKFIKNYRASVYGEDVGYKEPVTIDDAAFNLRSIKPLSRITLPIYGIIHEVDNTGMLVISESGANYAMYNYVSKSNQNEYYQSYFSYNYRTEYKQFQSRTDTGQHILGYQPKPNEFNLKQRFVFLSGSDANYVGVAKQYRHFLEQNDVLKNENEVKEFSTKINIIGNEVKKGVFNEKKVTITKYDEAVELIKKLQNDGYQNLDVTFKTFSLNDSSYRFEVFRNLGGSNDLRDMISYFNEQDIEFDYYVDYVKTHEQNKYTASFLNRKSMSLLNMSYVYLYSYLNNVKYMPTLVNDDLKSFEKYDINSLAFAGLSESIYTSSDKGNVQSSTENINYILKTLKTLNKNNISINMYNPDAYLYGYVNKYYDAPLTSSELMFVDATIPLVQLVTSGYMEYYSPNLNFVSNEQDTRLRLVEYGMNPTFLLTASDVYELKFTNSSNVYISQYNSLKNRMKNYNDFMKVGLEAVSGEELVNHVFLAEGVSKVEYANGAIVIINYTNNDYDYNNGTDTIKIKAKEYEVLWKI